jgi:hypothetical protein
VVWAISDDRLGNYLLPRDCPRVTFYAGAETSRADIDRFLGPAPAVVAVESAWMERVRSTTLYCYQLPAESFVLIDECAGYFTSRTSVTPLGVTRYIDPPRELAKRGVELRVLPTLWGLHDAVASSTLRFSMIRMRNAAPDPRENHLR